MTRLTITIRKDEDRRKAHDLVRASAFGSRIEFKQEKRSTDQNSKMWASLADVAEQVLWHGVHMESDDWKLLFLDALKREVRMVPNIDGNGFVALGRSSSDLSVSEMSDLIELIMMFGANHGVKFNEPDSSGDASPAHAHAETDAPAANGPHAVAAGVREEASMLSDDWRDVYITTMTTPTTRCISQGRSILSRHQTAIQMLGGEPNEQELAWMRLVAKLVSRRDENRLRQGEVFTNEIERLRTMPLPAAKVAA